MRLFYKIFILGIVIISFLLLTWYMLFPVSVRDAYLNNQGHFYFTLINNRNEALDLIYQWHLDDPKAMKPVYTGKGEIKLPARSDYKVMETFIPINDYDQRFFIMNIEVFKENTKVGSYNEQKSPYDWDYSTLPPRTNTFNICHIRSLLLGIGSVIKFDYTPYGCKSCPKS